MAVFAPTAGHATSAPYERSYVASTYGAVVDSINPGDYGNPAGERGPIEEQTGYTGEAPADAQLSTVYAAVNGAPNPLHGTPADKNVLRGTPADQWVAGAIFRTFSGTPTTLEVNDTASANLGTPVAWVATQCTTNTDPCAKADYLEVYGCTTPGQRVRLSGFTAGTWIWIYVATNDSAGVYYTGGCDSAATTGTIVLHTSTTT